MTAVIRPRKDLFVFRELVATVLGHKTSSINKVKLVPGSLFRQSSSGIEFHDLFCDPDACGTGAHEDEFLVLEGDAGEGDGGYISGTKLAKAYQMKEETHPAKTTAPVPWISSLKHFSALYLSKY
jgi:hypothetical protein